MNSQVHVTDEKLLKELKNLRAKLKKKGEKETGRVPKICSDEALVNMVEMKPKTLDDLLGIPGIGKTFVDEYGQQFLDVIEENTVSNDKSKVTEVDDRSLNVLKTLENKLVSLNGMNPLLFSGKPSNKKLVDMYGICNESLIDIVCREKDSITICDTVANNSLTSISNYRAVNSLTREIDKDMRDKGENHLYLAYPFVIGKLPGDDFEVRAPLVLTPVKTEKTAVKITLSYDDSRDTVYNRTLLLAFIKFNKITKILEDDVVDNLARRGFLQRTLQYYSDTGMKINTSDEYGPGPFRSYLKKNFPKFSNGELYLEEAIALGKYPICTNSIQKDFDEIIQTREVNELVSDLLRSYEEQSDFYAKSFTGIENIKLDKEDIPEKELFYINNLNTSQEKVLYSAKKYDELVVQGPPGTGKSQTIASLISCFVNDGKTVLMVSEKKTALDVVYSRLGNLSKYAMLIDDVNNKKLFYDQLSKLIVRRDIGDIEKERIDHVSSDIDDNITNLQSIAEKLYSPGSFGVEPYKLYEQCNRKMIESMPEEIISETMTRCNKEIAHIQYGELSNIYSDFTRERFLRDLRRCDELRTAYPYLEKILNGLSDMDVAEARSAVREADHIAMDFNNRGFFGRLFGKNKTKKNIVEKISRYFKGDLTSIASDIISGHSNEIIAAIEQYDEYASLALVREKASDNCRKYLHVMNSVPDEITDKNTFLFNIAIYTQIKKFESENRELFRTIDDFNSILKEIDSSIDEKRKETCELTELVLADSVNKMFESKRYKDIEHQINGAKRKWTVGKFIGRFRVELFGSIKIWMMTPEVVSEIIPLKTGLFDLLIFDEASQMFIEKGLPAILRAKKVVIAGDQKQLRPNSLFSGRIEIEADEDDDTVVLDEESLLDLAMAKYNDVLLNFHYRSRYEELIAFSNHAFYNGRLYVSPNSERLTEPPIKVHRVNGLWADRSNRAEAQKIVKLLKEFFTNRKNGETIGIITFNSEQRDLIEDEIDAERTKDQKFNQIVTSEYTRKSDNGEDIGLFIKNIENVQGDERDEIIFSTGYAKDSSGRFRQMFGLLNQKGGENRLNVAISRAKKKIQIVMSFHPNDLVVENTKNEGPRLLKKYLQYAMAVSDGDTDLSRQILLSLSDTSENENVLIFDSPFEEEVYDALKKRGYDVDTQIGIGGYRIDLAIKKEGKYVLGIECDGRLYHNSKSARERDYHRQKYLESRGWKIHRIWSSNWWNNKVAELDKIVTLIESTE